MRKRLSDRNEETHRERRIGQPEAGSDRHGKFHEKPEMCVREQACTHRYAVTKASQIGNSFGQFRFNDHRGNVNVSDVFCILRASDQEGRGQKTE